MNLAESLARVTQPYHQIAAAKWRSAVSDRATFVDYLVSTYHYVAASVPLMETALCTPGIETLPGYADYLREHVEEERDHDLWLLEDLEALGLGREQVRARLPEDAVAQMAGAAYYAIAHLHPVGLLGYIYALESAPPTDAYLDGLKRRFGLPEAALRTLREHGERDLDHRRELFEFVAGLTLSPWQTELVEHLAVSTLRGLGAIFDALAAPAPGAGEA